MPPGRSAQHVPEDSLDEGADGIQRRQLARAVSEQQVDRAAQGQCEHLRVCVRGHPPQGTLRLQVAADHADDLGHQRQAGLLGDRVIPRPVRPLLERQPVDGRGIENVNRGPAVESVADVRGDALFAGDGDRRRDALRARSRPCHLGSDLYRTQLGYADVAQGAARTRDDRPVRIRTPSDLYGNSSRHARLGNPAQAKGFYTQAVKWVAQHNDLPANYVQELRDFQAEALAVLGSVSQH